MAKKLKINPGDRFGKWTIIKEVSPIIISNKPRRMFECRCECGNIKNVQLACLINGHSTSCGCEQKKKAAQAQLKHGLADRHPLYLTWKNMKKRCNNPNASEYANYGGRGIKVCKEWSEDFKVFYDWSIENGWNKELSIDRIDNTKDYTPDNCRWTDNMTQMNNTSRNYYVIYNNKTYTLSTLASYLNIPYNIVRYRISCCKWNVEQLIKFYNDRN